jgi:hydrogenase nickel incorporation protein HypA/HybF
MHEYSIVQALLDRVERVAATRTPPGGAAPRVDRLHLKIGELSGVEVPLLQSAFDLCRPQCPICESAELEVKTVAAHWRCPGCGHAFGRGEALRCIPCGRPARLDGGDEIILERVEMEVPNHV